MMSRTKKPRKAYRPREVNPSALNWALAGAHLMPQKIRAELLVLVDLAFDKLRRAEADRDDWNVIANALNIAEALAGLGIGPNLIPAITAGHDAIHQVALRMVAGARSTCRGAELAVITEGLAMYRIQLRLCTQAEMSRAVKRVDNMHRSGAMKDIERIYGGMNENTKEAA